jgi:hypothetical protein
MKFINWRTIKEILTDKSALGINLLFIFLLVYIISTGNDHRNIKLPTLIIGISLIIFYVNNLRQPLLWYIFLVILLFDLIGGYYVRANHHFLLIYVTLVVIIYLHNDRIELFTTNVKFLLVIVLMFSGIQKLFSPQFISGDFTYYMINTGRFFKPILYFNQDMNDIIFNNNQQLLEFKRTEPNGMGSTTFNNVIPNMDVVSRLFAWMTISVEIIAGLLLLWKPKNIGTHLFFILLILGIFFTRLENGFLALLATSGIWLTDNIRIKALYAFLSVVFLSLIITGIGFY